jgi:hypothetical protein
MQKLSAVHREHEEDDDAPDEPRTLTSLATQAHIEGFVNACCYHMWASMV